MRQHHTGCEMPKWILLSDFFGTLRADDSYRWRDCEALVKNAMTSGAVPVRGFAKGEDEYQRIERHLVPGTDIDILCNRVSVPSGGGETSAKTIPGPLWPVELSPLRRWMCFKDVQICEAHAREWLKENATKTGDLPAESPAEPTAAAETKMNAWFENQYPEPVRRKEDVRKARSTEHVIGESGKHLSEKAFERAWSGHAPQSWRRAGTKRNLPPFPTGT